jgi:hypothetical protein
MKFSLVSIALGLAVSLQVAHADTVTYKGVVNNLPVTVQFNLNLPSNLQTIRPSCEETGDCGPTEFLTHQYTAGTVSVDCGGDVSTSDFNLTSSVASGKTSGATPLAASIEMTCKLADKILMDINNDWMNGLVAVPAHISQDQLTSIDFPSTMPVTFAIYNAPGGTGIGPSLSSGSGMLTKQ